MQVPLELSPSLPLEFSGLAFERQVLGGDVAVANGLRCSPCSYCCELDVASNYPGQILSIHCTTFV
jgi:hypothetical protein